MYDILCLCVDEPAMFSIIQIGLYFIYMFSVFISISVKVVVLFIVFLSFIVDIVIFLHIQCFTKVFILLKS